MTKEQLIEWIVDLFPSANVKKLEKMSIQDLLEVYYIYSSRNK